MSDGYDIEFTSNGTRHAFAFKLHDGLIHIEASGVLVGVWSPVHGVSPMAEYAPDVRIAVAQVAAIQWVQQWMRQATVDVDSNPLSSAEPG